MPRARVYQYRESAPTSRSASPASPWALLAAVVAVLLVALVGYQWWQYRQGPATNAAAVATSPEPAASQPGAQNLAPGPASSGGPSPLPSTSATPSAEHRLAIRLTERSWLHVTVDGRTQLEGLYPAGTVKSYTGHTAYLRAGNAGGVSVTVDAAPPKPLGGSGEVVEMRYTL